MINSPHQGDITLTRLSNGTTKIDWRHLHPSKPSFAIWSDKHGLRGKLPGAVMANLSVDQVVSIGRRFWMFYKIYDYEIFGRINARGLQGQIAR